MGTRTISQTINLDSKPEQIVSKYITKIDNAGIKVHAYNDSSSTADNNNYIQITSDGMAVIKNNIQRAKFGAITIIGKPYISGENNNESHLEIDYHSMKMIDKEGTTYFHISDLRDINGNIVEQFDGDGNTTTFTVNYAVTSVIEVLINDIITTAYTRNAKIFTFTTAPSDNEIITIKYTTTDADAQFVKAYSLGTRGIGAVGLYSYAEGLHNVASGIYSHAEGANTKATARYTHAEGCRTIAQGRFSHAEGYYTTASGDMSHVEGEDSVASGPHSHAEGRSTIASASYSHAEGHGTTASGAFSHAEGQGTIANYSYSHAEGHCTTASGLISHAEGDYTTASGYYSHAQNFHTIAAKYAQTALGTYNVQDTSITTTHPNENVDFGEYALIIGNGIDNNNRSNAFMVDWSGNVIAQGMAGMVQMFAGSTAPTGWLFCDGSAVSRTTYATLFAVIGTTYGTGDGSTTFNLPDMRGRVPVGVNNSSLPNGANSSFSTRNANANGGYENGQVITHTHIIPSGAMTSSGMSANATHSHGTGGTEYNRFITTTADSISNDEGSALTGSGYKFPRVSADYAFGSRSGNEVVSVAHTHTVPNANYTVPAPSGAVSATGINMPPFRGINFIICTGKTS